jgi:hypothetical protein
VSSATLYDPYAGRQMVSALNQNVMADSDKIARLGMTPRQQQLNHLWSWYRCSAYDARKIDWDGKESVSKLDAEAIATAGFIPPGFYDAGATFPLRFRKPTAPYNLIKVIVDRFTGLLFSEHNHPSFRVAGDPDTEDFVTALAESSRMWQTAILARTIGGAMGSVAVGFQFIDGVPVIEVHDPRWCNPVFKDSFTNKLKSLEIRYMRPEDIQVGGQWQEVNFWHRRIITETEDIIFEPAEVGDGAEPRWQVKTRAIHELGFCPVVWVQNLPVLDDIDGDPDCHGIYEMVEAIDSLVSQAYRGVLFNCDPTPVVVEDLDIGEIRKGSDNAIKVTKGGDFFYAELKGDGPKTARDMAHELRDYALEVAQCVLDSSTTTKGQNNTTATEIEKRYSAMLAKADRFREQYGQRCFLPLMELMMQATRKLYEPRYDEDGQTIVRQYLKLPPKVSYRNNGEIIKEERRLGEGGIMTLQWPPYFKPSINDVEVSVRAASSAVAAKLIDKEHAIKFVSTFFDIEDVGELLQKLLRDEEEQQRKLIQEMMGAYNGDRR